MLLNKYIGTDYTILTITAVDPYDKLLGTTMYQVPEFHFDPDPLYRETTFSQGWDPEKDMAPSYKNYLSLQKKGEEWLKRQKRKPLR